MTNSFSQTNQASQSGQSSELRGVLLPLEDTCLLLPNLAMAEVVGYREAKTIANAPEWLIGKISWNQRQIPLVSFDRVLGFSVANPGYRARIALCHVPSEKAAMPLVGILCHSIPRLARVNSDTLTDDKDYLPLPSMMLRHVQYAGEEAWIPDLEAVADASSIFF